MEKLFRNVMLAEFVSNSGSEPFMCFNAKSEEEQEGRMLEAFFNSLIAPLFDGTEAAMDVTAMDSKEKECFAFAVIDELYQYIIKPNLPKKGNPDVSFAVILTALSIVRHTNKNPFVCASQAMRIISCAPLVRPHLRPNRVRTFADELELIKLEKKLKKWGKVFSKLYKNVCEP